MRHFGIRPGAPYAIVEVRKAAFERCLCPECLRLDARHPGEGFQLALFPYRFSALARVQTTKEKA